MVNSPHITWSRWYGRKCENFHRDHHFPSGSTGFRCLSIAFQAFSISFFVTCQIWVAQTAPFSHHRVKALHGAKTAGPKPGEPRKPHGEVWGLMITGRVSNWLFKSGWCWTDCSNHWYLPPYHADWSPPQYVGWFCTLNCDWLVYLCLTSPGKNSIHSVVKTEINIKNYKDMKLNVCGAFLKWGVPPNHPQIIHFSGIFHYKPSILGYHHLWKPPYGQRS